MKTKLFLLFAMLFSIASCEKMVVVEEKSEPTSKLTIVTRSGDGSGVVSYPIQVYVFQDSKCVALQTLVNEDDFLSLPLDEGNYQVYAVGGASEDSYTLPSLEDAQPMSLLSLKTGQVHGDLMLASNYVTLNDGEETMLTLGMERKVVQLRSVVIKGIPDDVTAIMVSFAPVYQNMAINGTYEGSGTLNPISLTKQATAGQWKVTSTRYILPSTDKVTISIGITSPTGTKTYSYTCTEELEANYIFDIEGTYIGTQGVTLKGTFTGAEWAGERSITFTFSESGSSPGEGGGGDGPLTSIPQAGDFYKGCYVLQVNNATTTQADLLLLSPERIENVVSKGDSQEKAMQKINEALADWNVPGVTGWRLMTYNEAKTANSDIDNINSTLKENGQNRFAGNRYYMVYNSASGMLILYNLKYDSVSTTISDSCLIRPVADVHVSLQ